MIECHILPERSIVESHAGYYLLEQLVVELSEVFDHFLDPYRVIHTSHCYIFKSH